MTVIEGITWIDVGIVFVAGMALGFVLGHMLGKRTEY